MRRNKLKIGRFSYSNLFPIFYMLERECDCSMYEFIEGVPSSLNRMLRDGEVDISPSSSIEYLRRQNRYAFIEDISISSIGPVESIILFSKRPIEALDGLTVLTSSQSETSVALLEIIFKKFFKIKCNLRQADICLPISDSQLRDSAAYLLIGDDALITKNSKLKTQNSKLVYTYDLGEIWYKHTGLPFTFALWIHRKEYCSEKPEMFEGFKNDLDRAKELARENLKKIASASPLRNILSEDELVSYWGKISYDFGDEHKKGLELFRKFSEELGLLAV
ncbi:MAG: menaquinone biosynthesis protein [Nitrospirae bacterium]|nr:menaquinone biosynthesis protein [Nitrospirota bacterium]